MKRKDFLKSSLLLASSTAFLGSKVWAHQAKIRIALIGVNGMGWSNLMAILKNPAVECVALCDVDENILNKRAKELQDRQIQVKTYIEYKDVLKDKQVDAVIIATPDHWHCLIMVDAIKAGKHVYVEKPIGNSIAECQVMLAAAKKHRAIVQVGQWQRSMQHFKDAIDFVHAGHLGKVRLVKAWSYVGWKTSIKHVSDSPVPAGVHYDKWLGPAATRPFNRNRFHFEFRWFWDYAGGLMTDWGVHMLDYALVGMKAAIPKSIMAIGGKFGYPQDDGETPDTLNTIYEFDDFSIQWEHALGMALGPYGKDHGVAFIGNNGTLVLNRNGWEVLAEKDKMEAVAFQAAKDNGLEKHMNNFVEAIQRKDAEILHAPVQEGVNIAVFSQMGNIAYRTGKKLFWDATRQRFTDEEANKYLQPEYHNGYKFPMI